MAASSDRTCAYADASLLELAQDRLRILGGEDLRQAAHGIAKAHADRLHPGQDPSAEPWRTAYIRSLMRTAEAVEHG